jgi:CheY-like chemotaxis protein
LELTGRKILLVDDVRFTRLTLATMLRQFGQPVIFEAGDGQAALALLQGEASGADCVITDIDMPTLDGVGLLQAIRQGTGAIARDTRVVLLTGHSEFDRFGPALFLDLDGFLSKPVSKTAMETCLRRLFDGEQSTGPRPVATDAAAGSQGQSDEQAVAISAIPSDAELSRDLIFENGRLLLSAGSRVTPRIRDRLAELSVIIALPSVAWIRI